MSFVRPAPRFRRKGFDDSLPRFGFGPTDQLGQNISHRDFSPVTDTLQDSPQNISRFIIDPATDPDVISTLSAHPRRLYLVTDIFKPDFWRSVSTTYDEKSR
jgi:hypothetical protein